MTLATDRRPSSKNRAPKKYFTSGFAPGDNDVIIARGKNCYQHKGNRLFRQIVASKLYEYSRAMKKTEKSKILSSIVSLVRKGFNNTTAGHFVRYDPDTELWYDTGDFIAREKVSQTFRDFLHTDYRSSNEFKKKRRQYLNSKNDMCGPPLSKRRRTERRKSEEERTISFDFNKRTELSLSSPITSDIMTDIVELKECNSTSPILPFSLPRSSSLAQWFENDDFKLNDATRPMNEQSKSNWFDPTLPGDREESVHCLHFHNAINLFQEDIIEEISFVDDWNSLSPLPLPISCGARTA